MGHLIYVGNRHGPTSPGIANTLDTAFYGVNLVENCTESNYVVNFVVNNSAGPIGRSRCRRGTDPTEPTGALPRTGRYFRLAFPAGSRQYPPA